MLFFLLDRRDCRACCLGPRRALVFGVLRFDFTVEVVND